MRNKNDLMPQDEAAQRILHERAKMIANFDNTENTNVIVKKDAIPYIKFTLGNEYYGIPYPFGNEIIHHIIYIKVPLVPKYIAGIINRRGTLLTVLDLKKFLPTQISDYSKTACIIIVTDKINTIGVLADSIEDNDTYNPSELDPPLSADTGVKASYIAGLHKGLTTILDVKKILFDLRSQLETKS